MKKASIILLVLLASCNRAVKPDDEEVSINDTQFPNVIRVEKYGDTAKLEIERRGDTLIKHYIDLKGTEGDNFDDSYNATCTYGEVKNDTTIKSGFFIAEGDYRLYFDKNRIIAYCDSILKGLTTAYDINSTKPYYENLKQRAQNKTETVYLNQDAELIRNFNFKIIDSKTGEKPRYILIEYYRTEFSGGQNYFVITDKGDTVALFHQLDWIN